MKSEGYSLANASEQLVFGDSERLCNQLLRLVRPGKKTATCSSVTSFGPGGDLHPVVGRIDAAMNWNGTPAILIKTLEVTEARFKDVDESFALAEGENIDLKGWQQDHQTFFERNGGFSWDMILVCERFELVHDFESE